MILSWRSVGAGLLAAFFALPVAWFINPVHLGLLNSILLILSACIGFTASWIFGRKLGRHAPVQRTAIVVFAFIFFVGIYAPIAAVWANRPFYAWSITVKGKPKKELIGLEVAAALEKTAISTYLGMLALFGMAKVIARYSEKGAPSRTSRETNGSLRLGWVDVAFGLVVFLQSIVFSFTGFYIAPTRVNLFAIISLSFLQCFLFRSLRLHCQSLWKQPPQIGVQRLSKIVGSLLILLQVLCFFAVLRLFPSSLPEESSKLIRETGRWAICTMILLLPLGVYRWLVRKDSKTDTEQLNSVNHFAIRCGSWSLLGLFLVIGGLVLRGLVQKELNSASPQFATPFAYCVTALEPLCPNAAFLCLFSVFGGFLIAWMLPHRNVLARQRILASAQGGAVGGALFFVLLIVFALSLALCTVPCIPGVEPPQDVDMRTVQLFLGDGKWPLLGFINAAMAFLFSTLLAVLWAMEAMLANLLISIKNRLW